MYTIVTDAYDDASLPLMDRLNFSILSLGRLAKTDIRNPTEDKTEPSDARLWWSYVTFVMQVAESVKY